MGIISDDNMNISSISGPVPIKELDDNYVYRDYKDQFHHVRIVNTLTEYKYNEKNIIIKDIILNYLNGLDYVKECKNNCRFLNRHFDEITNMILCSNVVFDILYARHSSMSLIFNSFLLLLENTYPHKQTDGTIKVEYIYDNIDQNDVEQFVGYISILIYLKLIEIKEKRLG